MVRFRDDVDVYEPLILPPDQLLGASRSPSFSGSISSGIPVNKYSSSGKQTSSSTVQTIFNCSNLIMGVSLLLLPYAFKMSGWIVGVVLLSLVAAVASASAKILASCQELYLRITGIPLLTYGDIGEAAFGKRGRWFIQGVFSCELFAASVALFILVKDSMVSVLPDSIPVMELTLILWSVLTISTWPKSLSILSYGSMLGILCLLNLIVVVFFDGFYKQNAPGSLLHPATTYILPRLWSRVPLSFGVFAAAFAGHACFPGIYSSMRKPSYFGSAITVAFSLAFVAYLSIASAGYLMFGEELKSMITENLNAEGYLQSLYVLTMVLIIISCATKYPLTLYPVIMDLELLLFGSTPVKKLTQAERRSRAPTYAITSDSEDNDDKVDVIGTGGKSPSISIESESAQLLANAAARLEEYGTISHSAGKKYSICCGWDYSWRDLRRILFRTFISSLVLITSILIPEFERVIGLLGSLFSVISSVLFPTMCYLAFFKSTPPKCTQLPVEIRRSSSKWNEPDWLVESNFDDWEFVPRWKRILAYTTFVVFAIISILGTVWTALPESVISRS